MMNKELLWSSVEQFQFDKPSDVYGFSTRLAYENGWTIDFTQKAILEYKKFMYLAAISNTMVSPSEIVDIVWHQHLIFTGAYRDFCQVLGKRIEHIPSTHNPEEADLFRTAKEQTTKLYNAHFGDQIPEIWHFKSELDSLQLPKSSISLAGIQNRLLLIFGLLVVPIFMLLKPVFIDSDNPFFLYYFVAFFFVLLFIIDQFAQNRLQKMFAPCSSNLIIRHLSPLELVFLKTNRIEYVLHGFVNNLIQQKKIVVLKDFQMQLIDDSPSDNALENQIIDILKKKQKLHYPDLIKNLTQQPILLQYKKSSEKISAYFLQSRAFIGIYTMMMTAIFSIFSIGLCRLALGLWREKPISYLLFILILLSFVAVLFVKRIFNYLFKYVMPTKIKKTVQGETKTTSWEWQYLTGGKVVFAATFLPLVSYVDKNNTGGTGCGSGCGSSCGGGGGCGGGCGGCGG